MDLKRILTAAALALGLGLPPVAAHAATCNGGDPVRLAGQDWESADFTTHLIQILLQAAFDCKTDVVPGTTAALETALAQGDIDIIAEQWTGRAPIIQQAVDDGTVQVVGDTLKGGATQGWFVPDYVVHGDPERSIEASAPDLKSWRDLPRYKALFPDPEEPSRGRFLNCPRGWVCEKTNTRLLELYHLTDDYVNSRAGTGAALDSAISSAFDRGVPILFYYWQPAGLMAKYDFAKIEQAPFDPACWDTVLNGGDDMCASDFPVAHLGVAVTSGFADRNPQVIRFFKRLQVEPELLNGVILQMTETHRGGKELAQEFLQENPEVWRAWFDEEAVAKINAFLHVSDAGAASVPTVPGGGTGAGSKRENKTTAASGFFPDWSTAQIVNQQLMNVVSAYGTRLRKVSNLILHSVLLPLERGLEAIPPWLLLALVAAVAWHATRKPVATVLYVAGLYAIGAVGLWQPLMQTLALMLVATAITIVLGVPLGILAAQSRTLRRVVTPIMDAMQTLPSFVYLVPILMLFGLGKVPALFATVVYAIPPLVRLTTLGLRQVDRDITEAAQSFGVTRWQMLTRVTLPLARPSIMAGINQATMMALAMVVVASMIGARGLGEDVLAGIQTLDVGRGLQAGVAIVILAIVIDRITQAYGRTSRQRRAARNRGNRA